MNEKLIELANENVERVQWTLQDDGWQPTPQYVRKLLAAYRELLRELELRE